MDALYAASVNSFFNNEDSSPIKQMRRRCVIIYVILLQVSLGTMHAALPPELYWKSMLPNTTIPPSITDLIHPPAGDRTAKFRNLPAACPVVPFCSGPPRQVAYRPFNYGRRFNYSRHFETKDKPDTALYFLEKDLMAGHKMNLLFDKDSNQASFLPRDVVKSIPFSLSKMAEIFNKFAVKPGSIKAEVMKDTIVVCEEYTGIKGEEKYCATSLESMLDFTILKLGKDIEALFTEVTNNGTKKQEYKIMNGVKKVGETKLVVCHKLDYVYAVFYCHKIDNTVAYTVSLEGADRSKVKAVSICHRDTSAWNPKHLAFQMLKVKPGRVSICHFLFQDSIAWLPKQN